MTADRTAIACWGSRTLHVRVGRHTFEWSFLLAAVAFPIIGADFLAAFDLKVNLRKMQLEHGTLQWTVPLTTPPPGNTFAAIGVHPAEEGLEQAWIPAQRATSRSSPRQVSHGSSQCAEFPTIRGAADPPRAASSTPKFRAPGKHKQPRLPGNVKSLRATGEKEGEYPSTAGSPGSHVKATTPLPAQRATLPAPANPSPSPQATRRALAAKEAASPDYQALLESFPAVLNSSKVLPPARHHVQHIIETEGNAATSRYRRLDPARLAAAKEEFASLEKQGLIRRSSSNWSSPLHMVKKPDGTWRCCGDYRLLNTKTKPDRYSCPNLADLAANLHGATVFSKLDLRKGYHQVPVHPRDVPKTAVVTPFGLFEYLRMPFGLRNAGQTFQRLMDEILQDVPHVFVYMDDILVASANHEEHVRDLRAVLTRLQKHGMVLNGEKCVLGVSQLEYLGHVVSSAGLSPLPDRVAAIQNVQQPTTGKELMTYLGMINFYRRFIKGAASVLRPLTDALRGGSKGPLVWTPPMQLAFEESKRRLVSVAQLAHPDPSAELQLAVDASDHHVGAVLQQQTRSGMQPLSFFSKKLDSAQQKYSAFDRELLAVYLAVRHFRWALEGRQFHVLTDHKPLTFALHRLGDAWSARQQRHLSYVSEYTTDIRHVAGSLNVVADALSRPPGVPQLPPPGPVAVVAPTPGEPVTLERLAAGQLLCEETQQLASRPDVRLVEMGGQKLLCMDATGALRPLVPVQLRRAIFDSVHCLAHAGVRATTRMLSTRYVWPGCARDATKWVRDCQQCARGKPGVVLKANVEPIPIPAQRFSHVHVDLVGPLPRSSKGHSYLLTMVDRATRWPEVVPLLGISAEEVADAFVDSWVARFGVPATVTTDRGTQFSSSSWACLCQKLGMQHVMTTAYHPQSNGLVERFHRQLKEGLRARASGAAWLQHLPFVLLGLRAAPKEEANVSSAEAVLGEQPVLPGQLVPPQADLRAPDRPQIPSTVRSYASVAAEPPSPLQGVEFAYVHREPAAGPLEPAFRGPYRILDLRAKVVLLQIGDRQDWVSVDRVKPHRGSSPVVPAQPPRRGRPPKDDQRGASSPSLPTVEALSST